MKLAAFVTIKSFYTHLSLVLLLQSVLLLVLDPLDLPHEADVPLPHLLPRLHPKPAFRAEGGALGVKGGDGRLWEPVAAEQTKVGLKDVLDKTIDFPKYNLVFSIITFR